jgi:hypothetical protein
LIAVLKQLNVSAQLEPQNKPFDISAASHEQIDIEIQKGFDDLNAGKVIPSWQVREEINELYGI